ncbi:MAG TPA: bifunctional homocysteine S-methyltransferase/methylenetetrahydrofolate reductase [Candidatus Limnocylindrales bacterium]
MTAESSAGLPRPRFRQRLATQPLLVDGGLGTLLFSRGVPQRACLEELVLSQPELVGAAHREYLEAGAELIETLSFGANRRRLATWGLEGRAGELSRRAAQLARAAREVSGRDALVGGSVGPLGPATRGAAAIPEAEVRAAFREQIDGLLEGGVDAIILETFSDLPSLLVAVDEARLASDLPVIASLTFGEERVLVDGSGPAEAAAALGRAGADVVGVNCGAGPTPCLDALEAMGAPADGDPFRLIMPNAGLSQRLEGRFLFAASPEYFGTMTPRMLAAGARILGGCCGTTPEHIAAMRLALDKAAAGLVVDDRVAAPPSITAPRPSPATSLAERAARLSPAEEAPPPTRLAELLAADRFVVSVEIDPPRSIRIERTIEAARLLRDAGVDVVNVSDSAMARVRMSALSVAFGIQHDLDLECLVHCTTRDRNLMALESELLGAHALGVRNIIALTGDPPRIGDYPTGTGVWDVDSIGLIEILTRLNRAEDPSGASIGQRAGFTIACALDSTAADQVTEWDRLERKLAAGAHLVMTQPLYSVEQVESMFDEARRRFGPSGIPVPVLLGVLPLVSTRHAEFLHNEVPGITIPDEARAAMRSAGERGSEVGIEMADRLLASMEGEVAGTYIMPSFGRYEQCAELVRRIRARHPAAAVAS